MSVIRTESPLSEMIVSAPYSFLIEVHLKDGTVQPRGNAIGVKLPNGKSVLSTSAHAFNNQGRDLSSIERVTFFNPDTGLSFDVEPSSISMHPQWLGFSNNSVRSLYAGGVDLAAVLIPAGVVIPTVEPFLGSVSSLVGSIIDNVSRGPGGTTTETRSSTDSRAQRGNNIFDDDGRWASGRFDQPGLDGRIIVTDFDTGTSDPLTRDGFRPNPIPTNLEVQLIQGDSGSGWYYNGQLLGHPSFSYAGFQITVSAVLDIPFLESVTSSIPTNTPPSVNMPRSILTNENQVLVAAIVAADADSDPLVFSLQGVDAGIFTITNGNIQFVNAPDFEASRTTYEIALSVSDNVNPAVVVPITVVVENVNEAPSLIAGSGFTIAETAVDGTVVGIVAGNRSAPR